MSGFRNKVIHKGYFPSRDETLNFIKNVYEIIKDIFTKIIEFNNKSIIEHDKRYFKRLKLESITKLSDYTTDDWNYKIFSRPFSRTLITFLSNINNQLPEKNEIYNYIENLMTNEIE